MTQEQKAKAYDEAIERAEKATRAGSDTAMDIVQYIFPQLAESKEEKIRKEMLAFFKNFYETGTWNAISDCKEWITYLEKQKDASKAIEAIDRIDKYIDEHLANAHDMKDSDPNKKYYRGWDDALGNMAGILQDVYSNEYPKEQWLTAKINGEPIPTENYSVDIPLAEWSDEDSDNLERVDNYLWMLDDYVGDDCAMPQGKTDKIRGNIQGILSPWLKSLPERFKLQPKQEWSEEDEHRITDAIYFLESAKKHYADTSEIDKTINYLKSFRPAWKPNEAQMRAIRNFSTGLFIGDGDYDALLSLKEDLGKLYYKRM